MVTRVVAVLKELSNYEFSYTRAFSYFEADVDDTLHVTCGFNDKVAEIRRMKWKYM